MKSLVILIPGLAMNAMEYSKISGTKALQNPGFGKSCSKVLSAPPKPKRYTIDDVAKSHIEEIEKMAGKDEKVTIVGFSMGGMVLSVMASKYRDRLPKDAKFIFVATSPNNPSNPAIKKEMLASWANVKGGDLESFDQALSMFFSDKFRTINNQEYMEYIRYRAFGENQQSVDDYKNQIGALLSFDGREYYKDLNPGEAKFYFGSEDSLVNSSQIEEVRKLIPTANIEILDGIGHMVHLENQKVFEDIIGE